ncbi:MAG: hypothetical protein E6Q97_12780 [Desulfurellales bacterium]|nr:MAG: hypothetical protein E6Q97_12780 [Desulfurellales bacterium]
MGYDMRMVNDPTDQSLLKTRRGTFYAAVKARDALPKHERGNIDPATFQSPSFDFDDHSAWVGRTPRYAAAQDAVCEASRMVDNADAGYFCLNIWGMSLCRQIMAEHNMLADGGHPLWPEAKDFDATSDEIDEWYDKIYYPEDGEVAEPPPNVAAYFDALKAVKCYHPEGTTGVPTFKLCSNDGWVVTSDECRQAVDAWNASGAGIPTRIEDGKEVEVTWWPEWVDYMSRAADHGGFYVR